MEFTVLQLPSGSMALIRMVVSSSLSASTPPARAKYKFCIMSSDNDLDREKEDRGAIFLATVVMMDPFGCYSITLL